MKRELPWPYAWDDRPRGWYRTPEGIDRYGPLPLEVSLPPTRPTPEAQAAEALLKQAKKPARRAGLMSWERS